VKSSDRELSSPLSAEAVREAHFSTRRRGYDVDEVSLFLTKVANDIQSADSERTSLRAQLHSARGELDRLRGDGAEKDLEARVEISVHAVGLLSQAQQTADSCVAEAEQYARDMIQAARGQYRDILERAQQAAAESTRHIEVVPGEHGSASVPEIEYVRTYARVAQVQLRSVLDALTHEVDKLGQLSQISEISEIDDHHRSDGHDSSSEEVSWEPNNLVSLNASRVPTEPTTEPDHSYGGA
jgi:DivIVA domain-containing protein